jgi:hypothetical protein
VATGKEMLTMAEAVQDRSLGDCPPAGPLRTLFTLLIDDAAVFPPARKPLAEAVDRHRAHRAAGYRGLIGPLLVPARAASELAALAAGGSGLRVGLIARPGEPPGDLLGGVQALRASQPAEVAGVELGWTPGWRELGLGGLPVTLEVPRGSAQLEALRDVARAVPAGGTRVKFRTGATPAWAWPDEAELAQFIGSAVAHGLVFKLTGGLHHAVRGTYLVDGAAKEQHGLLNVLCAVAQAVDGTPPDELRAVLAERDAEVLSHATAAIGPAGAARVRAAFASYGCCEVTDPVRELTGLGLLPRAA